MEDLRLSELQKRYFSDLFLCCDEEGTGKAPLLKATELFRTSGLTDDIIKQIAELCYPQSNLVSITHINRKQFYSALKLVAAYQANMPLSTELLSAQLELPLPRFTWTLNCETDPDLIQLSNSPISGGHEKKDVRILRKRDKTICYCEPMRLSSNSSEVDVSQGCPLHDNAEAQSTDSEVESETVSQNSELSYTLRPNNESPWSTASESPTPLNSLVERSPGLCAGHTCMPPSGRYPPVSICEEHTQLLGTEEESSDRHSSEEECVEGDDNENSDRIDWRVGSEQRLYYITQFRHLQPEINGLVPGKVARRFFEKSRLPVSDLHKIWLLSDVTKDGALCIEEFITAMHLVVLRRKNIPVPNILPQCLVPNSSRSPCHSPVQVTSNLVDLDSYSNINTSISSDFNLKMPNIPPPTMRNSTNDIDTFEAKSLIPITLDDSPPSINSPIVIDISNRNKPENLSGNKEWTKFIDSPTSSISSPGPKPVNFDFHKAAIEKDPKIYHPVPLRVTPEASSLPVQTSDSGGTSPRRVDDLVYSFQDSYEITSPKKLSAQLSCDISSLPSVQTSSAEFKPIQRPQAKKGVMKNIGALPPPPTKDAPSITEDSSGPISLQYPPKKDPPPPPPPRPLRTHTRSSSLDLNKLKGSHIVTTSIPPQVPPRISPSLTSPQGKKLINQRSEGDVLGLIPGPPFSPPDVFNQNTTLSQNNVLTEEVSTETFANFAQFQNNLPLPAMETTPMNLLRNRASFEDSDSHISTRKHGAFEVYRKPTPRNSESPDPSNLTEINRNEDSLKKLQERNTLLSRLCQELSLELADVQKERETLRLRLEVNSTGA